VAVLETMSNYEELGVFYLGRTLDPEGKSPGDLLLYDAKDLTTHAVCVGMTGSGKTGLCLSLLEEAAMDGVPTIAIDPKGDLGNLLLAFPDLAPSDFRPWIDLGEATRKGRTPDEHAAAVAEKWRKGLASWDQDGERIRRFREAADCAIYTPGSTSGLPLSALKSLSAPGAELLADGDALRERVSSAVSGLLALLGIDADPIQSREHILLSNIVHRAWASGGDLSLADLIRAIQDPGFERLGVFDLDSFFPPKARFALAMQMNNLLASPGFSAWMEGPPLSVPELLWTPEGKPRIAIISIAHMNDNERMFFVTLLLNEIVAWMRTQPGTSSLRALLYMDEVFGFFPPVANPPSKRPLLTLMKQARAFGLGVVLATQNPVDIDYKGLSNAGTWFLGRLQTERDKARVMDGLEGAAASSGAAFDRGTIDTVLSGLQSRQFLLNNVHEDAPALFGTRWVMSYLRGPLTRAQIKELMKDRRTPAAPAHGGPPMPAASPRPAPASVPAARPVASETREILPPDVSESFVPLREPPGGGSTIIYKPALLGRARTHFVNASLGVDEWRLVEVLTVLDPEAEEIWGAARPCSGGSTLEDAPVAGARFADLPSTAAKASSYKRWGTQLKAWVYRTHQVKRFRCKKPKMVSSASENERAFRARLSLATRESRDAALGKLRERFTPKVVQAKNRLRAAQAKLGKEQDDVVRIQASSAVDVGASLLGALFGRRSSSRSTAAAVRRGARSAQRVTKERQDVEKAQARVQAARDAIAKLEAEVEASFRRLQDAGSAGAEVAEIVVKPRKADTSVVAVELVWTPWACDAEGREESLFGPA
jgi:hypothetical protein